MAIRTTIWCDECGEKFDDQEKANIHGMQPCISYKKGDRVEFLFRLFQYTGTVTGLGGLVGPGEERVAFITADEKVCEPEEHYQTGHDVYVPIGNVWLPKQTQPGTHK